MIKIAQIGDIHITGKKFERAKSALFKTYKKIKELGGVDLAIFLGDVFTKYNVGDNYKTTGEQQKLFLDFILSLNTKVLIIGGNHDSIGVGKSSLEYLKYRKNIFISEKPEFLRFENLLIGTLPWLDKKYFFENYGIDKTINESKDLFNLQTQKILGKFKYEFEKHDGTSFLLGHCNLQGTKLPANYLVKDEYFSFNYNYLRATNCSYISLGHIHTRSGPYIGALYQNNFGEESNPQGFEYIEIQENNINEKYIEIDMPKYITIDIKSENDLSKILEYNKHDIIKLRFHSELALELHKKLPSHKEYFIENCVQQTPIIRCETVKKTMSPIELLGEYIKIKGIPAGLNRNEIIGVLNDSN